MHARPVIFVVEDDPAVSSVIKQVLDPLGIDAEYFATAHDAIDALDRRHPERILLDLTLRNSNVRDVVHALRAKRYRGLVHMMSGSYLALIDEVERVGVHGGVTFGERLNKPFRREALLRVIAGNWRKTRPLAGDRVSRGARSG